jgi:predicted nucleotidyltransferase
MFETAQRERVLARLVELAEADQRIVTAAIVGSLADGSADEWSDIDLAMGVDEAATLDELLAAWSDTMADEFDAVALLDLTSGVATYRVFMLDDWLQVDLSFARASQFHKRSERFKLLFGTPTTSDSSFRDPNEAFGWAVLYARTARASIDRRRWWSAEFCISALRDETLAMACAMRGISSGYGRGIDDLPRAVISGFEDGLVRSLARDELLRALDSTLALLIREAADLENERLARLTADLPSLAAPERHS